MHFVLESNAFLYIHIYKIYFDPLFVKVAYVKLLWIDVNI